MHLIFKDHQPTVGVIYFRLETTSSNRSLTKSLLSIEARPLPRPVQVLESSPRRSRLARRARPSLSPGSPNLLRVESTLSGSAPACRPPSRPLASIRHQGCGSCDCYK